MWFGAKTSAQQWQLHWWKESTSKPVIPPTTDNADHLYWYDQAGNLASNCINDVYTLFYYNPQNKLALIVKEETTGPITNEFIYDSQNRRIGLVKVGQKCYDISGMAQLPYVLSQFNNRHSLIASTTPPPADGHNAILSTTPTASTSTTSVGTIRLMGLMRMGEFYFIQL